MGRLRSPEMLAGIERVNAAHRTLAKFGERTVGAHESLACQMDAMALQIDLTLKILI